MSFFRAVADGFRNYFSTQGRASRRDFWYWLAFCILVWFLATFIDGAYIGPARGYLPFEHEAGRPLARSFLALFFIPTVTTAVRRLHDSNKSGWWLLIGFTIIGLIPLIYYFFKSGNKGENRFGS